MSARADVLLWAQRVIARKGEAPHVMLDLHEDASADEIQETFHNIARTAHPDLHRHGLEPDELELVNSAYAAIAGAYQEMRYRALKAGRLHRPDPPPAAPTRQPASTPPRGATLPPQAASSGFVPAEDAAQHMSPKAVIYYRKAETCVKRGDLRGAILQLKLAISTDPLSVFLRTALAEVEAEARRAT